MITSSSWTETLLVGLAELLADAGIGAFDADSISVGTAALPAIHLITLPEQPEHVICLTDYPVTDDPGMTEAIVGVQVRTRGGRAPFTASQYRDGVYEQLHGRTHLVLGAVTAYPVIVAHIYRQSATPIGPDSQGRQERVENYYVHVNRSSAASDQD